MIPDFSRMAWAAPHIAPATAEGLWQTPEGIPVKRLYGGQDLEGLAALDTWPGLPPFVELDWVGKRAALGTAEIAIIKRTRRCVATNVDPVTAERDMEIPASLLRLYDHMDCGVYAEVRGGGMLHVGDSLILS